MGLSVVSEYVRFVFAVFLLAFLIGGARADGGAQEMCEATSSLAKKTMSARQAGVEMSHLMRAYGEGDYGYVNKLAQSYVVRAYAYPRVYDEKQIKDLVKEFGSSAFVECFRVIDN